MNQKSIIVPIISILISFNFLTSTQVYAVVCNSITNQPDCTTTFPCKWDSNKCIDNTKRLEGSTVSQALIAVDPLKGKFNSPSSIINDLLPYLLSGAGLILFAMLIMGGFTMMTAVNDAKKAEAGKSRITAAIIGFVIIFAAYWIAQIIEIVFGVSIL